MLPIRLELHNFLAYRNPDPISFDGIDMACLSGPNGAGKSSLLDAITWALWGRARARYDDELVHMGQEDMYVQFDFRQDEQAYRVLRQRSKRGRGQGLLTLFAWDDESQQFCQISESSLRDTQTRITRLLHLDYDTFVNSAFLQQGRADSFTAKTPAQRKMLLADILGLDRWETYETRVKEKLADIAEQMGNFDAVIAEKEQTEAEEPRLRAELTTATQQFQAAQHELEIAQGRYNEVAGAPAELQGKQAQFELVSRQIKENQRDLASIETELSGQQERLVTYQQVIASRDSIEEGYSRLENARQTNDELAERLSQLADIEKELNGLARQLDADRARLQSEADVYRDRIADAEKIIKSGELVMTELAEIDAQLAQLEQLAAERDQIQETIKGLSEENASTIARNESLDAEINDLRKRLDMLEVAGEAICPVCRQPLDEQHRHELDEQYRNDGKTRQALYASNRERLKEIEKEITTSKKSLKALEAELRQQDRLNAQGGGLRERVARAQEASQRLDADRAAQQELEERLSTENFSLELRAQIAERQTAIDALGYDKDLHSEAKQALKTLRAFETQKRELDIALETLPGIEVQIQSIQERRARCEGLIADAKRLIAQLEEEIAEVTVRAQEAQQRQLEVNKLRVIERTATEKLIAVQQRLDAVEKARQRRFELLAQRDKLQEEAAILEQLKDAFGKNGVPAMVIEAAIPELEEGANRLLSKMTDGRLHVRFDTQREKKTGGVIETLDILISDELGTRSYDMFSGGEGFRINFALRIALSQFLAHRAGARLQTLVIDEGFGSQDAAGRERLVEAINAIREDFDLILVVTHIDELRDAFPAQIEVRKTPNGSVVTCG